jgi:hypothetical protein
MNPRASRIATGTFLVLAAIFAAASLYAIFRQAVYIPYWDQWGWIDRYLSGQETLLSLFATPINGHIVAVPGLVYWIDAALGGASNRVNLVVMIVCIAGTCLLLRGRFAGLADAFRGRTTEVYFAATAVLMLWFHNWENLFWPFQVHLYLSILFALACLHVLSAAAANETPGVGRVVPALALGLLAGVSFGPGLGVWAPALLIVVLGRGRAPWKWVTAAAVVAIAGALAWYLSFWVAHESHPVGLYASLEFVALFLGSPFLYGGNVRVLTTDPARLAVPLAAGYAGLLLACGIAIRIVRVRARRPLSPAELFFAGVATFALVAGAMAAVVRGGGGAPSPALASRYGVLCLLFWLSAVPLAVAGLGVVRIRLLEAVAPVCMLVLLALSQVAYLGWWLNWRSMIEAASASLASGVPDPEYLGYVLHRPDMVERVSERLVSERLSPLYDERDRFIGRPLAELGEAAGPCVAPASEAKRLPAGYRLSGALAGPALPFGELPVVVTGVAGRVIGLGNVDRGWWSGPGAGFLGGRMRAWRAFVPVDESAIDAVRVYASVGRGWCELPRAPR